MPLHDELNSLTFKDQNERLISIIYDKYAAAIYGTICSHISDKQIANALLVNVFLEFSKEVRSRDCITEGPFICLYRISKRLISENCNGEKSIFLKQGVSVNSSASPLEIH
jgi:hypothetical protein